MENALDSLGFRRKIELINQLHKELWEAAATRSPSHRLFTLLELAHKRRVYPRYLSHASDPLTTLYFPAAGKCAGSPLGIAKTSYLYSVIPRQADAVYRIDTSLLENSFDLFAHVEYSAKFHTKAVRHPWPDSEAFRHKYFVKFKTYHVVNALDLVHLKDKEQLAQIDLYRLLLSRLEFKNEELPDSSAVSEPTDS